MPPLPTDLRNKLERTIVAARDVAEAGARAALEALAVHHHEPYAHQTPAQRKLRNHLRAHAMQLGDARTSKGELGIDHLVHECAYEHWHRMLFARFLAENDLLIEPSAGVAISLQECEELAKEAMVDPWAFASRCAQQMLPEIFRPDDPVLLVALASEHRVKLERLVAGIEPAAFKADDALGWVYQFWQSKKKDEVNASGAKISGDMLPAVTQLFTEHYMVLFLLHNTIGAWHAGKVLEANPALAESAGSEVELRTAVALSEAGGYAFEYLRFVRGVDGKGGPWRPAAGTFEGWPRRAAEINVLDPCCGSGHFLVAVFDLLVRLRMHEEKLALPDALDAVLRDNLLGLEIDPRCTQIAAFNVALAAWKLCGFRRLPSLHIACTGIAPQVNKEDWLSLADSVAEAEGMPTKRDLFVKEDNLLSSPVRLALDHLYDIFQQAPEIGSLIDPVRALASQGSLLAPEFREVQPLLAEALSWEGMKKNVEQTELGVAAQGIAKAAELLSGRYTLVITNVPYLGRGKQGDVLRKHLEQQYAQGKADLATAFVLRCLELCARGGSTALVTPQNWLFLTTYTKLRGTLLKQSEWDLVARLGAGAFETISGEVVNVTLLALSAKEPAADHAMAGIDVSAPRGQTPIRAAEKAALLRGELPTEIVVVPQAEQLKNPDSVISFTANTIKTYLRQYAGCYQGLTTADDGKWRRQQWEVLSDTADWLRLQTPSQERGLFSGREDVVSRLLIDNDDHTGVIRGRKAWGNRGIGIDRVGKLSRAVYDGDLFHSLVPVVIAHDQQHQDAVSAFCLSDEFVEAARSTNQALSIDNGYLNKLPFDIAHWQKVAAEKFPNGLPEPESGDPTQWPFHGRPEESMAPLLVAVARMLGYRWPAELDDKMRLSKRARDLVKRCDDLLKFADDDGIVCISSIRGEEPAADRMLPLLTACGLEPDRDLDDWLRNGFYQEHCELFHQRPFIWHIWDGRKRDGFHALVNYHRLAEGNGKGRKLLESLTYSYLGDWITRQQDGVKRGEDGAEDRLAVAMELQKRLVAILAGEPPFDIFVRWKPLHELPIGWEPDINDGVRMNIRPFLASDLPNGRTGAGVLRWKPNIKWDKDRGKEPERKKHEFPWFWGWDEKTEDFMGGKSFDGNRWNNCHYSVEGKREARETARGKKS